MPTFDQNQIAHDRANPRLMALWWALRPLTSVVRFMQTGAHPDDEISGMLAALAFRDGLNLSYACSTRGEGGQNDIGTEAGGALGALRTREMERACDVLGMRLYWHSTHAQDTIVDFGFSKSGEDTLARWGHARTLQRFVEIVRAEKPDILCPTFLDVPGQHGHHRAMTQAAFDAIDAAADPAFSSDLPPWQVKKLYLPAWSGAGQAYDDDLPPPPATLTVCGADRESMTGWNWDRIGQQSRAFHRSQGMGRWVPAGTSRDWPLHLAKTHLPGPDQALWSGVPQTLGDLAGLPNAAPMADALRAAQLAITAAIDAFPRFASVADHAQAAQRHCRAALRSCPAALHHDVAHLLEAKEAQLAQVLRLALGVEARAYTDAVFLDAGATTPLTLEVDAGSAEAAQATLELLQGWSWDGEMLSISTEAEPTDAYRAIYDPVAPQAPRLTVTITHNKTKVSVPLAMEIEPVVLPATRLALTQTSLALNTALAQRDVVIGITDMSPKDGDIDFAAPKGWQAVRTEKGLTLTAPSTVAPGHYTLHAQVNTAQAATVHKIAHDHIAPTAYATPAIARIGVFEVALPQVKVGYIGGGNDRVDRWLRTIGLDVTTLTDAHLAQETSLDAFDAIVVGIFAMRFRANLVAALPSLHRWTHKGGSLVTLYHRPWDNWDPDTVPPKRIEIGQPSLRWRVTDEAAQVTHLEPHPILETPNQIGPADWQGWVKERGLYFAKSWDAAYTPLLSMADPGEDPLTGALLVADIGTGRHVHSSLILHHQMEHLVPGAFRLMANFLAPRR